MPAPRNAAPAVMLPRMRRLSLAAEGELSRACAALVDHSFMLTLLWPNSAPSTPPLHRPDLPWPHWGLRRSTWSPTLRWNRWAGLLRRRSAPGPSGLRGDHLREALGTAHSDEVVAHLAGVVRLLASGGAPPEVAAHLAGGALLALPKGDGDVRPIAVGETLRRLVGKCLCEAVREDVKAHFCPLQVGVATPLGAEGAGPHALPDLTFGFLDDVCLAGNCRHVASALHWLHVEVEKPGLLPPQLDADGAPENGVPNPAGRRSADIWVAAGAFTGLPPLILPTPSWTAPTSCCRRGRVGGGASYRLRGLWGSLSWVGPWLRAAAAIETDRP
ncbi:unnamed protein product, partial [Effrenium voratum]